MGTSVHRPRPASAMPKSPHACKRARNRIAAPRTTAEMGILKPPPSKGTPLGKGVMSTVIRNWVQTHRYQQTVRHLRALSPSEIQALGIDPSQMEHLAEEVSRTSSRPRRSGGRKVFGSPRPALRRT